MNARLSFGFILFGFLLVPTVTNAGDKGEFFDGKTFNGWHGLIDRYWKITDGAIVGHSGGRPIRHNTFLCSKKQYGDFELSFQVRIINDDNGKSGVQSRNSGIQIRSMIFDKKKFAVRGPQCDMGGKYWGCLYGEHFGGKGGPLSGGMMKAADPKVVAKALKQEGFNDYYIRCVGTHVTIKLNGQTTVDGEFKNMPKRGIIAWQLHSGGAMTITFRNIRFVDLSK